MHAEPVTWGRLVERLADMSVAFLRAQVAAGASAVQLFDSWAGCLSPAEYERYVLPTTRRLLAGVAAARRARPSCSAWAPASCCALMATSGADVVGVDWRVPLDEARRRIGPERAVQGNLDPAICLAPWEVVAAEAAPGPRPGRRAGPGTSSTWATASCPRPTRGSWPPWSTWSTPRDGPGCRWPVRTGSACW